MKFQAGAALFVSAALPVALAQTWTACNPLEKTCPCDVALGKTVSFDFTKGEQSDLFPHDENFKVEYKSDGVHLPVGKKGDAPTLIAQKFILGGRLEATLKIAPGKGIVSSLVFQSDDLDEIDYEWIGSKGQEVQTNYFGKGNTKEYNRGGIHPIDKAEATFHTYVIDWTKERIVWTLDGTDIRTLTQADSEKLYASKNFYPQTPMQIKIGAWAAGDPSNSPGVVEWSDGPIDYPNGPYEMVISKITLTDYTTGASQYCYGDKTGSWESIVLSKEAVKDDDKKGEDKPDDKKDDDKKGDDKKEDDKKESKTEDTPSKTAESSGSKTTLATSTTEKSSPSPKTTSSMGIDEAISKGIKDSIGAYTPEPQNKGVSTSATATAKGASETSGTSTSAAPSGTNTGAASTNTVSVAGLVVAAFAAIYAL